MMRIKTSLLLLNIFSFVAVADAALVLSFSPTSSTTVPIGGTVDVDVLVTQTAPATLNADLAVDGILAYGVGISLNNANFSVMSASTPFGNDASNPSLPGSSVARPIHDHRRSGTEQFRIRWADRILYRRSQVVPQSQGQLSSMRLHLSRAANAVQLA